METTVVFKEERFNPRLKGKMVSISGTNGMGYVVYDENAIYEVFRMGTHKLELRKYNSQMEKQQISHVLPGGKRGYSELEMLSFEDLNETAFMRVLD